MSSELFSAVVTAGIFMYVISLKHGSQYILGHVPFIRAPRGNAAEMIAKKLETKIRDAILSASRSQSGVTSLFTQDSTGLSNLQRPRKLPLSLRNSRSSCQVFSAAYFGS